MVGPGYTVKALDQSTWPAFAALVERNNGVFGGSITIQFQWPNIAKREFDWLILTGLHIDEWYIFCVPEIVAKSQLMTKSTGGTINYNVTAVNPGWRQQELEQTK